MRDFVILHAESDSAAAARLEHALGGRGAVCCALRANAPLGNFGPQFMMVALWSEAAEAAGLTQVMAQMLAGRARAPSIVTLGAARAPAALLAQTPMVLVMNDTYSSVADVAVKLTAAAVAGPAPTQRKPRIDQRKAMNFAATAATAMFSFAGSAVLAGMTPAAGNLAWAASDDALEPNVITAPAASIRGMASVAAMASAPATPDLDPILARAEQIMAQAQAIAGAPAVQARFEMVQRVAASQIDLRLMFVDSPLAQAPAAEPVQLAAAPETPAAAAGELRGLAEASMAFSGIEVATVD